MNLKKYFLITILITTISGLHCKIADVAIFLDAQHEEKTLEKVISIDYTLKMPYNSYEELSLKECVNTSKRSIVGPILRELIRAIEQDVKIIIVSEALARCLIHFLNHVKIDELHAKARSVLSDRISEIAQKTGQYESYVSAISASIKESIEKHLNQTKKEITIVQRFFNSIGKKWSVYKNTQKSQNLAIFIHDQNQKLAELGLNNLHKIKNKKDFISIFSRPYYKEHIGKKFIKIFQKKKPLTIGININELLNIFQGNNPKIVYISGHGAYAEDIYESLFKGKKLQMSKEARIVQLTYEQNSQLINKLNNSGCVFLAYNSCFAGGQTLLFINKEVDTRTNELKEISVKFPILVAAFSDAPTTMPDSINFKDFYEEIRSFFQKKPGLISLDEKEKIEKWFKKRKPWIKEPFKTIAKHITGTKLENTPSIIFPGLKSFKTIDVDKKVLVMTYPLLIGYELKLVDIYGKPIIATIKTIERKGEGKKKPTEEEKKEELKKIKEKIEKIKEQLKKFKQEHKEELSEYAKKDKEKLEELLKEKKREEETIRKEKIEKIKKELEIDTRGKIAVALYVTILEAALDIYDIPALVSMIPGPANHFINKIDALVFNFDKLIKEMFGKFTPRTKKLFYINKLICNNYKNSGISYPGDSPRPSGILDIKNLIIKLSPEKLDISFNLKTKEQDNMLITPHFNGVYTFATKQLKINPQKPLKERKATTPIDNETIALLKKSIEKASAEEAKNISKDLEPLDEALEAAGITESKEDYKKRFEKRLKRAIYENKLESIKKIYNIP
ncbi:hypothetical protein ACFLYA_01585 [Candidatus Dependentiae bacterium]